MTGSKTRASPLVRDDLLVDVLLAVCRAVRVEVVEQASRLVLLGVETGETSRRREWCPASTTFGWMRTCVPVSSVLMAELLDVEAELVEALHALVDAPALGRRTLRARELLPGCGTCRRCRW